jgi:hypothetical protein
MLRVLRLHKQAVAAGATRRAVRLDEARWDTEASCAVIFLKVMQEVAGSEALPNLADDSAAVVRFCEGDYSQELESLCAQTLVLKWEQIPWADTELARDQGLTSTIVCAAAEEVDKAIGECEARTNQEREPENLSMMFDVEHSRIVFLVLFVQNACE